jgi:putative peptide maturation system protein
VPDAITRRALDDTYVYLATLIRDGACPAEALSRLPVLRALHPSLGIELIWEELGYANIVHYDALLNVPGGDATSLSISPAGDTPWPLRGARLTSDHELLRVNGTTMRVDEAMGVIDFIWDDARIVQRLVDFHLVGEEIRRRAIVPEPEDRQRAVDTFRRVRGLVTAAATQEWLEAQGISHARLEQMGEAQAQTFALRRTIAMEAGLQAYWAAHPGAFDVAIVARLRLRDRARAQRLADELRGGQLFYAGVEDEFAAGRAMPITGGMMAVLRRHEMSPTLADAVFLATPGSVVGPIEGDDSYDLIRVIRVGPASFGDDDTREAIIDAIFAEWLAERRRAAKIEWLWGPVRPA